MFRSLSRHFYLGTPLLVSGSSVLLDSSRNDNEALRKAITKKKTEDLVVVSGTANKSLATKVAKYLDKNLSDVEVKRFRYYLDHIYLFLILKLNFNVKSDGEISCAYNESVRGRDVFIIQSCAAPVNDNIMEILLLISAARRAGGYLFNLHISNYIVLNNSTFCDSY